jgi:hypothetical protein
MPDELEVRTLFCSLQDQARANFNEGTTQKPCQSL